MFDPNRQLKKDLSECTFTPIPQGTKRNTSQRSIRSSKSAENDFYQGQLMFQQNKEKKIEDKRQKIYDDIRRNPQFKPSLMTQHELLNHWQKYEEKKSENRAQLINEITPSFQPKLNDHRHRQASPRYLDQKKPPKQRPQEPMFQPLKANEKSDKIVLKKFTIEFSQALKCVNGDNQDLTSRQAEQILILLGFISGEVKSSEMQNQIDSLIQIVSNEDQSVCSDALFETLCKIQKLHGFQDGQDLTNQFMYMLQTRKAYLVEQKRCKKQLKLLREQEEAAPLKPNVSERSNAIVRKAKHPEMRRDDSLTQQDKVQILVKRNSSKKLKVEEIRKKQVLDAVRECTFKPITNEKKPSGKSSRIYSLPRKVRTDRDQFEIEYNQQKEQCTFKPKLNTKKPLKELLLDIRVQITDSQALNLLVYEGDDVEKLVEQFTIRQKLDQSQSENLLRMIKQQLSI